MFFFNNDSRIKNDFTLSTLEERQAGICESEASLGFVAYCSQPVTAG